MNYTFKIEQSHKHFIHIIAEVEVGKNKIIDVQLPSWRPGRYELGNFAKNVKDFEVVDKKGDALQFQKITKDKWQIKTQDNELLRISYLYYSAELNAGSTFLDENQLYINPINCCVYLPENIDKPCTIELKVPDSYKTVSSLLNKGKNKFYAQDFHQLVDSPIISSSSLQFLNYISNGTTFNLYFQGEIKIDKEKIVKDFKKFTDHQISLFGSFPVKEYFFLFQITPYFSYHGVEHHRSTVILLGPSYKVFNSDYNKLLGISSHELYHTWNVKGIRPFDMFPYDYSKENYSQLGYVAEGVTTYMGDRILYESGVFSEKDYFLEFSNLLERHFHNDGRNHYSVAESSFDTWLDGYVQGIPGRKVSIYVEGALIAFICDARIRKHTDHKSSLHDVMSKMYSGTQDVLEYDEYTYKLLLEEISGTSFDDVFNDLIKGKEDFMKYLEVATDFFGWKIIKNKAVNTLWNYGIKSIWTNNRFKILNIVERSSADESGLIIGDLIHSVNGFKLNNDLDHWLKYFKNDEIVLSFERKGELKRLVLKNVNEYQYWKYHLKIKINNVK